MIKHTWKNDICQLCRIIRVQTFENGFHKASYFKPDGSKLNDRPDCLKVDKAALSLFGEDELQAISKTASKEKKKNYKRNVYQFDFEYTETKEVNQGYELHAKDLKEFMTLFKRHYLRAILTELKENGKLIKLLNMELI